MTRRYTGHKEALEAFNKGLKVRIVDECEGAGYESLWDGKRGGDLFSVEDYSPPAVKASYDANGSPIAEVAPELWYTKEEFRDLVKDLRARIEDLSADNKKLTEENLRLVSDNRELTKECMVGLEDTGRLTKELNVLKARTDVQAYERLGAENLSLIVELSKAKNDVDALAFLLKKTSDERNELSRRLDELYEDD